MQHNRSQHNTTQQITTQHDAMQLNRYNTTPTQRIATQCNAAQPNRHNTTQWIATQCSATQHNGLQHNATQRNITDTTQQNSPQQNKTGNENHAHMLNKPVEVTLSSTKNSTEKNGQKTLQVYCPKQGTVYIILYESVPNVRSAGLSSLLNMAYTVFSNPRLGTFADL